MRRAVLLLGIGGLSLLAPLLWAACGGGEASPDAPPPAPPPAAPPPATLPPPPSPPPPAPPPPPPQPPDGAVTLNIAVLGEQLEFDKDSFTVSAGDDVVLSLDNGSTVFDHNWVLVQPGTKDDVAFDGITAGAKNDWVQPDDSRVIAKLGIQDPGSSGEVRFTAPAAGTYQFVCTFPAHNISMFGDFVVTP